MAIPVSVILERKGTEVVTTLPEATLMEAAEVMTRRNVGALVVSQDGRAVNGIVSERDLMRCIAQLGPGSLQGPVRQAMTSEVQTCDLDTTADELMSMMTERRIRHIPVVTGGALAGIVSIGDVVKSRLDELEVAAETLERYVTGST